MNKMFFNFLLSIFFVSTFSIRCDFFDDMHDEMRKGMQEMRDHISHRKSSFFAEFSDCGKGVKLETPEYGVSFAEKDDHVNFLVKTLPASVKAEDVVVSPGENFLSVFIQAEKDTLELKIYPRKLDFFVKRQVLREEKSDDKGKSYCAFSGAADVRSSRTLPVVVGIKNADRIKADLTNGILTISIEKKASQRIEVTTSLEEPLKEQVSDTEEVKFSDDSEITSATEYSEDEIEDLK